MWRGWWAWGVRNLTAAFRNRKRIAPTRQLAHGVAESASREQQQQQQQLRGARETIQMWVYHLLNLMFWVYRGTKGQHLIMMIKMGIR